MAAGSESRLAVKQAQALFEQAGEDQGAALQLATVLGELRREDEIAGGESRLARTAVTRADIVDREAE